VGDRQLATAARCKHWGVPGSHAFIGAWIAEAVLDRNSLCHFCVACVVLPVWLCCRQQSRAVVQDTIRHCSFWAAGNPWCPAIATGALADAVGGTTTCSIYTPQQLCATIEARCLGVKLVLQDPWRNIGMHSIVFYQIASQSMLPSEGPPCTVCASQANRCTACCGVGAGPPPSRGEAAAGSAGNSAYLDKHPAVSMSSILCVLYCQAPCVHLAQP